MSETPKKKPASRKAKPDAPEADKTENRSDAATRKAVLEAALPHAAFDGFTDRVLEDAGKAAGLAKGELARLFPDGPISLIECYSDAVDAEMRERLAAMDLPSMKIRARITEAVKTRLAILKRHKEAARRAAALLSLPMHATLAAKLMYRSVDAMWRAAGDTATDFNFYTKRGILAGVYGSTLVRWFADASADEAATNQFLAARIENVMQFETFKAKAKEALSNFPAFADWAKPKSPK
ncbi:MAG TPA: COQ9 family protein [Rhizomicrobium sp.]|nr:COQ9 family protein [Rhizomicrobium sp.]